MYMHKKIVHVCAEHVSCILLVYVVCVYVYVCEHGHALLLCMCVYVCDHELSYHASNWDSSFAARAASPDTSINILVHMYACVCVCVRMYAGIIVCACAH